MNEEEQLIVDFPTHRIRSVRFAETSKMYLYMHMDMVQRDNDNEEARRQDLWCSESDYARMKLARKESVWKVKEMASAGVSFSYSGDGDDGSSEDECLIGIEHLLSTKTVLEVITCRRRCARAVLEEQARQRMNPPDILGPNKIATASFLETRRAADRALKLGKLQRKASIWIWGWGLVLFSGSEGCCAHMKYFESILMFTVTFLCMYI